MQKGLRSNKKKRFIVYLWIGLLFFMLWIFHDVSKYSETAIPRMFNNLWRVAYLITLNFIVFEYAWPFIANLKNNLLIKIIIGILFLFIASILYSFGLFAWRGFGIALHIYTGLGELSHKELVMAQMGYSFSSVIFFGIAIHLYDFNKLKQDAQKLRIQKQEAELNYLKSQTNPHFLFNTLNNIYALTREKSDLAPESVLRLSKILRYMLYETGGDYVAIEQELKIIADYIALEKLRYDESLRLNFNYDVEDMKQAIPPLLLIPLVENAFKHGVSETRGTPFIDIHLSINNRQLAFSVKNSSETNASEHGVKENIGLSNLRRQLELLYKSYDLSVKQHSGTFEAILQINLGSHV